MRSWETGAGGSAYLDDGTVVEVPATALEASSFRFVRPGQRVRLLLDARGAVLRVLPP
jgi:hypothetical protein